MVQSFLKVKVARSRAFMEYAHSTKPAYCCVCNERPFSQLHHFGSNGGRALKPSDYQVARVCKTCADKWELKRNALIKNGYYEILACFQRDALELHEGWLEKLEGDTSCNLHSRCKTCENRDGKSCCAQFAHVEPPGDCAVDELVTKLATGFLDGDLEEARSWLVEWSNRRSANVIGFLVEPMVEIAFADYIKEARFVAAQSLKVAGIKVE